jgi:hypothetical protein
MTAATGEGIAASDERAPSSLGDLAAYFLRLGTFGFGGPIALAGYMQRDRHGRRGWRHRRRRVRPRTARDPRWHDRGDRADFAGRDRAVEEAPLRVSAACSSAA